MRDVCQCGPLEGTADPPTFCSDERLPALVAYIKFKGFLWGNTPNSHKQHNLYVTKRFKVKGDPRLVELYRLKIAVERAFKVRAKGKV